MSKLVAGKCSYSNAVVSKGLLIAVAKTVEGVTSCHGNYGYEPGHQCNFEN